MSAAEATTVMIQIPQPATATDLPICPAPGRSHATRRPTASLRRGIQALVRSMRFCLIRNLQGEYRFIDVSVIDESLPHEQVEFLLFLTEGRTCSEILRALPNATRACHFDERFGAELAEYFDRLGTMLKYNSECFVPNEPVAEPAHDSFPVSRLQTA